MIKKLRQKMVIPTDVYERRWWILAVMCLSLLVVMVGNTALNVALPILSRELHATNAQIQWMVDSYSLVFAGLLFTMGSIGDRFGRKGILQIGLALFAGAAAYAGLVASSANEIIAARAVMGLAGSMVMPATLSILTNVFPPKERARAVGLWAGVSGAGIALGPLLTGYVLEHFAWGMVFVINLPIIIVALLASAWIVPKTSDPTHTKLDPAGAALSIVGLVSLVYAIIEAPSHGWLASETLTLGIGGLVAMAVFVWWELRAPHPMLDMRLFKSPAFGISSLSLTLVFFALMGMFFSMSMLMQLIFGYTPLEAAVRMLPVAATMMIGAPLSALAVERLGKRKIVAGGMLIVSIGTVLLSMIGVDSPYLLFVAGMVVMAFGMSIAMSPTTDLLMSSVPRNRAGMGSAMNDTTRELGGALGIAVLGSILASHYSASLAPALIGLPDAVRAAAEQSLAGALVVGQEMGGQAGVALIDAAQHAWIGGYQLSLHVGAALIAIAAIVAYIGLPDKADDSEEA